MSFKFENLGIWKKAMEFGDEMYELVKQFPAEEKFNLKSQLMRAVDSIALNIAEGSILQSNAEFKRFLGYSIRSLAEVVTCLHKAKRRNYVEKEQFEKQYKEAYHLMNMMIAFRRKLIT